MVNNDDGDSFGITLPTGKDDDGGFVDASADAAAADATAAASALPNVTDLYYQKSEYRVEHIGKRYKSSKRRVTWTFCRRAAIAVAKEEEGEGQEKQANNNNNNTNNDIPIEVCLEWSLYSGKQRISVNGKQEYFTQRKNASLVEHQWELLPIQTSSSGCSSPPPPTVVSDTATSTTTTTTTAATATATSPGNNKNNNADEAAWLILHLVAARVQPSAADSYMVLEELLLDNVRFAQLPNQEGEAVPSRPSAKLYELSASSRPGSNHASTTTNNNATSTSTATTKPTSILDILYPGGVTGPAVFCAAPVATAAAAPAAATNNIPRQQQNDTSLQQQAANKNNQSHGTTTLQQQQHASVNNSNNNSITG